MSFVSPSSSWFAWLVFVASIACVGGTVLFVGLAMEKASERPWYRNTKDLSFWKRIKCIGEWLVIVGVVFEILSTAIFAIRGEIENRRLDPLNQPVLDISAFASVQINGLDIEWTNASSQFHIPIAMMGLGYSNDPIHNGTSLGHVALNAIEYLPTEFGAPTPTNVAYLIWFKSMFPPNPEVSEIKKASDINKVEFVKILCSFLKTNSELTGGEVTLRINSEVRTFKIIPSEKFKLSENPLDGVGQGTIVFATNSVGKQ
jgi:hypothetical protein